MKNDPERTQLLQQINELLMAVDSMQTCLEALEATKADGSFDIARTNLRIAANEAAQVVERQQGAHEQRQRSRQKVTLATSLLAGAEASEWQANKLKANGDEAGARKASESAIILRKMASEAAVTERRQSIHLVPTIN